MEFSTRRITDNTEPETERGRHRKASQTMLDVRIARDGVMYGYRVWVNNAEWDSADETERNEAVRVAVAGAISQHDQQNTTKGK